MGVVELKKIVDIYPQIFIFCLNIFCNLFLWIYNFFAVSSVQSISSELKSTTEGNSHGQQLNCNWAEFFDSFAFSCFAVFYFICCSFFITTATAATTTTTHWLTHSPLSRSNFNVVSLVLLLSLLLSTHFAVIIFYADIPVGRRVALWQLISMRINEQVNMRFFSVFQFLLLAREIHFNRFAWFCIYFVRSTACFTAKQRAPPKH